MKTTYSYTTKRRDNGEWEIIETTSKGRRESRRVVGLDVSESKARETAARFSRRVAG